MRPHGLFVVFCWVVVSQSEYLVIKLISILIFCIENRATVT